ncbi:MAG: RNA polymerase sigma factor [bacterium]|nr:RNA polymerase sigma factor [bacterium]
MDEKITRILQQKGIGDFEEFVRKYEKMVYGIAYKFLNNHQDAQDATQETFLIAFKKMKSLKKPNSLNAWIYTISLNVTREIMRKKHKKKKLIESISQQPRISAGVFEKNSGLINIDSFLKNLSGQQRRVIELRYLKELKIKEISKILGCKTGTVKTHIFRGLRTLRDVIHNGNL